MSYQTLTIEFNYSSSLRFKFALDEAHKHPSFKDHNKIYSVTYTRKESESTYNLSRLLKGFRNKRVFIDGTELPWSEAFHYLDCFRLRERSFDKKQYCMGDSRQFPAFNPWRCIQAMMPLSGYVEWLHYGKFDLDGTFIFDKEKIKHYLLANTHPFRFCPVINTEAMLRILEAFPETVNPKIDHDWRYSGSINNTLRVGISISAGQEDQYYSTGVEPSSPRAIKNIYQKILDKLS